LLFSKLSYLQYTLSITTATRQFEADSNLYNPEKIPDRILIETTTSCGLCILLDLPFLFVFQNGLLNWWCWILLDDTHNLPFNWKENLDRNLCMDERRQFRVPNASLLQFVNRIESLIDVSRWVTFRKVVAVLLMIIHIQGPYIRYDLDRSPIYLLLLITHAHKTN
jgi:hypothetical protein